MEGKVSSKYIARCHKTLVKWGAPVKEWECIGVLDSGDDSSVCELCGCGKVRYVHVMHHDWYFENVYVGCICAGVLEGDVLAAKERERIVRNRGKRKQTFLKKKWMEGNDGERFLMYRARRIEIYVRNGGFGVICEDGCAWDYKGRKITNFLTAVHAAFDLVDLPVWEKPI